jgi:hypothetical protein
MSENFNPKDPAIRCFFCPCGCVCLRWRQGLLMHFDRGELGHALDCLGDVLQRPACGFSLGESPFCACYARDGHYYLLCRDQVVLRLSEEEARSLHSELASAYRGMEQQEVRTSGRVM